jgi:hypothetical protein
MRELHWHPHADEWQYYLEGAAEMAVYLGMGHAVTEQFVKGDIGYVPRGAGHYIRNTGSSILRLLIGFNNGHYHSHDLNAWLASNPPDVLASNLGLPLTVAEALPKEPLFIAHPQRSAGGQLDLSASAPYPPPLSSGSLAKSWENDDGVGGAQAAAAQWAGTFKDFAPVQNPNTFTLDVA